MHDDPSRRTVLEGLGAVAGATLLPNVACAGLPPPPLDLEGYIGGVGMRHLADRIREGRLNYRYDKGRFTIASMVIWDDAFLNREGNIPAPFRYALSKHLLDGEDILCRLSSAHEGREPIVAMVTGELTASDCHGVWGELAEPPHHRAILLSQKRYSHEHQIRRWEIPPFRDYRIC
jgi:hypothetical protein